MMQEQLKLSEDTEEIRAKLLSNPDVILDDPALMKALIAANEGGQGGNIVDLRGIAMDRLERRLDRLEDTHRTVIAAAYENMSGTTLIQNAVLKMLEPLEFPQFLNMLANEMPEILKVGHLRMILETHESSPAALGFDRVLRMAAPGATQRYITGGRNIALRPVTLRQVAPASAEFYGASSAEVRSEAMIQLDLGEGRLPGLLLLGSEDPHKFRPNQGTDLLTFFGGAFERALRRWLG